MAGGCATPANKQTHHDDSTSSTTGNQTSKQGSGKAVSAQKVVIDMDAQGYTPVKPTADNPHPSTLLGTMAKQYEKLHPNVTINFLPVAMTGTLGSPGGLVAKANAGEAPDIVWAQENQVNSGAYPAGLFVNLKPYLEQPNPYIPGNRHWIDAFDPAIIRDVTAPNGDIYVDSAELVGAAVFYNKQVFQEAGIKTPPKNLTELMDDAKTLRAHGFWPFGLALGPGEQDGAPSWFERYAMSSFFQSDLSEFDVDHNKFETGSLDYAVAVKKGLFTMKDPRYAEVFKLLKQFSQVWEPNAVDYTSGPNGQNLASTWLLTPFMNNKLAMVFLTSGAFAQLKQLGWTSKQYGVIPFPNITKASTPYAGNTVISYVVNAPTSDWQYYVSTPKADHSMTPTKLKWTIDWLKYITTPKHSQAIINQRGTTVPTMKGTKAVTQSLKTAIEAPDTLKPPVIVDGILDNTLTPTAANQGYKILTAYLTNQLSFSQFAKQWDALIEQQTNAWAAQNNVDLSKYLK